MKYSGTKEELGMIETGRVDGTDTKWFIPYQPNRDEYYYLLTDGTMPRYDGDEHYHIVYYSTKKAAEQAFEAFKISKEIKPKVKEEPKVPVKRLDKKGFMSALDEI